MHGVRSWLRMLPLGRQSPLISGLAAPSLHSSTHHAPHESAILMLGSLTLRLPNDGDTECGQMDL